MKISNTEKNLLAVVGIVLLGAGYYQFVFVPQKAKVDQVKEEYNVLQSEYDTKKQAIADIGKNTESIKELKASIYQVSNFIYPEIWQEKLTKEISLLKEKSGLKGSLTFEVPTYMPIAAYFEAKQQEGNTYKTLDDLMKDYGGVALKDESGASTTEDKDKKEEVKNKLEETKELGDKQREEAKASEGGEQKKESEEDKKYAVRQMKVTMNYEGTHDQLITFIKSIDGYDRLVAIPSVKMTAGGENPEQMGRISGTLTMEFYAVPKVGDEDLDYFDWDGSGVSGKENPFRDMYTSNPNQASGEELALMLNLRPAASDLPSIMIGRPNDSDKATYIESTGNKKENVEINFTSSGGKYFVNYTMGGKTYPATGGVEIGQSGKLITMDINSAPRLNENDKVAVQVTVRNATDKKIAINIKNDDKTNPRVKIIPNGDVQYANKE